MTVIVDRGIRRGTDVLKAMALGADFTFVGRPFLVAAALGGGGGVEQAVRPLREGADAGEAEVLWGASSVIQEKLARGEKTDAVLLTTEAVDALVADGKLDGGTRVEVAMSRLGVAVPRGHKPPDLSSEASFRQALLDARSVAF